MSITELGIIIEVRLVQNLKAPFAIFVTLLGIVIEVILSQAWYYIFVSDKGEIMFVTQM